MSYVGSPRKGVMVDTQDLHEVRHGGLMDRTHECRPQRGSGPAYRAAHQLPDLPGWARAPILRRSGSDGYGTFPRPRPHQRRVDGSSQSPRVLLAWPEGLIACLSPSPCRSSHLLHAEPTASLPENPPNWPPGQPAHSDLRSIRQSLAPGGEDSQPCVVSSRIASSDPRSPPASSLLPSPPPCPSPPARSAAARRA